MYASSIPLNHISVTHNRQYVFEQGEQIETDFQMYGSQERKWSFDLSGTSGDEKHKIVSWSLFTEEDQGNYSSVN